MIPLRRQALLTTFKFYDLVSMVFCFFLAASIVSYQISNITFGQFLSMRIKIQNFVIFLGFILTWHIILSSFGFYHSKRLAYLRGESLDIVKATSLLTLVISVGAILFRIKMVTPIFVIVFWFSCNTITITGRLFFRYILKWLRVHGHNLRFMLIIGTGEQAVKFAQNIETKPELGYHIIGFVNAKETKTEELQKTGVSTVANFNDFPSFLRNNVVDEVVICLPAESFYQKISRIINLCEEHGIVVRMVSDIFNLKLAKSRIEEFEGDMIITVYTGSMEGWSVLIKRFVDFFLSLVLLILLSPLFLFVSLLIKLTSPGPIFFIQERVGLGKRKFSMYKFRTMVADAEERLSELEHLNEIMGPAFKIKDDPRITLVGKYLRKIRIDELPQLLNVLKGDMSLVGPRPLPMRDYEGFNEDWQRRRFSVRPGITCLWQIGEQHSIPFKKWMELDMQYIDQWSLWLDFKILLKTIPAMFKGL